MNNVSDILYSKSFIAWFHLQSQWEAVKISFLLDCPRSQRLSEHRVRGAVDYANTNCWRWKDFACFVRCFKCCPQKCGRKLSGIFPLISTSLNSKLFFTLHFFFFYLTYFLLHIIIDSHVYYSPLGKHSFCQTYFSLIPEEAILSTPSERLLGTPAAKVTHSNSLISSCMPGRDYTLYSIQ